MTMTFLRKQISNASQSHAVILIECSIGQMVPCSWYKLPQTTQRELFELYTEGSSNVMYANTHVY